MKEKRKWEVEEKKKCEIRKKKVGKEGTEEKKEIFLLFLLSAFHCSF